jgi:hypothetical protein
MALNLKKIERTVLSYCEIPEKIAETCSAIQDTSCDVYVEYRITPVKEQAGFDDDFTLDNWLVKEHPELEGRTILIHINY